MSRGSTDARTAAGGSKRVKQRATRTHRDDAMRSRVIEAAVTCVLERGFYRASSNEIARAAGVTWGVIQHYFGTRESLMLAVLQEGSRRFEAIVEGAEINGETVEERIDQLIEVLSEHYGRPEYLVYLQILLNMEHDPRTSADVRKTMRDVAEQSNTNVRRLLKESLGSATSVPDLATTLFLAVRGFLFSQQLLDTMAYDTVAPQSDRVARQRRLLGELLSPYVEAAMKR
jgi:AcrR family transcriptional regulator